MKQKFFIIRTFYLNKLNQKNTILAAELLQELAMQEKNLFNFFESLSSYEFFILFIIFDLSKHSVYIASYLLQFFSYFYFSDT